MPYARRRFRRYRKKPSKKGSSMWSYAKKALRVANFVRSLVNVEYKYIDTGAVALSMNSSGAIANLTTLATGTTNITRNGNSILAKSFYSQISFKINALATTATICRVIYFIDKQDSASVPATSDVLQSTDVYAPVRRDNGDRFKILYDKQFAVTTDSSSRPAGVLKVFRKLNMHIKYIGSTASQADTGENQIYVLTVTDAGSNNPTFNHNVRIRFIDN